MTSVHEPVLHALSVEPRVARPGETVSVIFRTRNLGTSASPPGTVVFLLGDGLAADDDAGRVAVESVAPGDDVVAVMRARVAAPLDDRTELTVQAALHLADAVLGTNVCTVLARSRPVLDGAASGTFVESTGADSVRVRAVVTNEGDGAARGVRVEVPAPAGCVRADGEGPAVVETERLEVGASVAVDFEARIVEPIAVLQADDGDVRFTDGRRCALPVREVVVMDAVIAEPCVVVRPSRRSVDVAVDVRNDGWVDARDVRVRIALPAPLRAIDGSLVVDGVPVAARGAKRGGSDGPFARLERVGGAHVVVVPVAARSTVRVALAASFPGGCAGGTVVVGAGAHEVAVAFEPEPVRDVRMRLVDVLRTVARGGEVRVVAEVVNAGDVAEELFFCITGEGVVVGPHAVSRTVAPGLVASVDVAVRTRESAEDGGSLHVAVIACDAERERARAEFAVTVRDRSAARGDEPVGADLDGMPAVVQAVLRAPDDVSAGAPFTVRAELHVEDSVEVLALRLHDIAGAAYVPGSTSLDGRSLLDRAGVSPLAGAGLTLRGIPAGTRVVGACTFLAEPAVCDEAIVVEAMVVVDGEERALLPAVVRVRGREAFTAQPAGMRYHVDACVIESRRTDVEPDHPDTAASAADPSPVAFGDASGPPNWSLLPAQLVESHDDAFTFELSLGGGRFDEVARLMNGATGRGLVPHVLAVRAFFPDCETSGDRGVASALDGVRSALRDVFDRLFVKLRIPGFDVACDDLDDIGLRTAMTALFERLVDASPGDGRCDGAAVRITRDRVCELLAAIAGAPYGAPAALRALVALLPTGCAFDPVLGTALARYACALDDALARYEGVPLELFDDALAHASDPVLDIARAALVTALRDRAGFTEVAC